MVTIVENRFIRFRPYYESEHEVCQQDLLQDLLLGLLQLVPVRPLRPVRPVSVSGMCLSRIVGFNAARVPEPGR